MSFPVHITFRNMQASASVEALVRRRAEDLVQFAPRISACNVVLDCLHPQNHLGRPYGVHIDLAVPGGTVVVNRDAGGNHARTDLTMAVRDAFDTARRQLQEHNRRMERAEKRRAMK